MVKKQLIYSRLDKNIRWLGIIDYKSLIVLLLYMLIIWAILGLLVQNVFTKIYMLIILLIPIVGFFYANRNSESIVDMLFIVMKYLISPKMYVYKIESRKYWIK